MDTPVEMGQDDLILAVERLSRVEDRAHEEGSDNDGGGTGRSDGPTRGSEIDVSSFE